MTNETRNSAPTRTCVGCGRRDAQASLVRVRKVAGSLVVSEPRRGEGRSAYVHPRSECVQGLARSKVLGKSLRTTIAREARIELMQVLQGHLGTGTAPGHSHGPGTGV